ncbi:MAG: RNA-binding S4 domain-containing protein [Rhodospirillaceae bacterium]|nr:RNA-binding S4 domain-containing protein [Rhodospirillaceae bacterium]
MNEKPQTVRLDKWLWYARFFKSRTLAGKFCHGGGVRIDGELTAKSHVTVHPGNVLTFVKRGHVRIIHILKTGTRRGPAVEARALYEDLSPEMPTKSGPAKDANTHAHREPGQGRPTKAERRAIDKLKPGS